MRVSLAAVNQCAGNGRGLFNPRMVGAQWGNGAMGNALWEGVRLKDVLALKSKLDKRQTAMEALAEDTEDLIETYGL